MQRCVPELRLTGVAHSAHATMRRRPLVQPVTVDNGTRAHRLKGRECGIRTRDKALPHWVTNEGLGARTSQATPNFAAARLPRLLIHFTLYFAAARLPRLFIHYTLYFSSRKRRLRCSIPRCAARRNELRWAFVWVRPFFIPYTRYFVVGLRVGQALVQRTSSREHACRKYKV